MSRNIPANVDADLDDAFIIPVFFVHLDFDTQALFVHTDLGDINTLGETWVGTGGLGSISQIEETSRLDAPGIKLRMQITDESAGSLYEELTQQDFYQRPVIIYFSTRDTVTGALTDTPFELFRGKMDVPELTHGETLSFADMVVESEWIDGQRANGELYSDAQLQSEFSGDLGFKYVAAMVNTKIVWGARETINLGGTGNAPGGSSTPGFRDRPGFRA